MCAVALVAFLAPNARAAEDALRCGEWLVTVGAEAREVVEKCGPPTAATRRDVTSRVRGQRLRSVFETWTYDRGPTEFVRVLYFQDNVLKTIEVGSYGH